MADTAELVEPAKKRAVTFIDGQNLFRHAMAAFGYHFPNFDPLKLANLVCSHHSWAMHGVRFYTGYPTALKDPMWHGFWSNRLLAMRRSGIFVEGRLLKYREVEIELPDGSVFKSEVAQEKGIDVRLAIDVIRMAHEGLLDVAVIFSQDQDLAEVAKEVREISRSKRRWLKIVSAFPDSSSASSSRGIDKADWFKIDKAMYDNCLDVRDYRPKKAP